MGRKLVGPPASLAQHALSLGDVSFATSAAATAEWREPIMHENAFNSIQSGKLKLWQIEIPFDFTLTGMATQWGSAAVGTDTIYNTMYLDAGFRPTTLLKATSAIAMGTGGGWAAETFTGVDGEAGLYWIGPLPVTAANRDCMRVGGNTLYSPWRIQPEGTGSTPSVNIGNPGTIQEQSSLSSPPSTWAGGYRTHQNDGSNPLAFWLKIAKR